MISIEKDEDNKDRFEFNKPFRSIEMKYGKSSEILPDLNWDSRKIIWLDYDGRLSSECLSDLNTIISQAITGSVFLVSVNAAPTNDSVIPFNQIHDYRLRTLKHEVGEDKVPDDISGTDLAGWGTANVCRRIIFNEIEQILSTRNAGREEGNKLCYGQLFNFHYSDNAKMLTTGGLIYDEGQKNIVAQCGFTDLPFVSNGDEPYKIEAPNLTFKEIRHLDEQLPKEAGQVLSAPAVKPSDVEKYEKVYRFFPAFTEANL